MGRKPKLNYEEQIKKLKSLGILFNEIKENEAKEILKNNTYFLNYLHSEKTYLKIVVEIIILNFPHYQISQL